MKFLSLTLIIACLILSQAKLKMHQKHNDEPTAPASNDTIILVKFNFKEEKKDHTVQLPLGKTMDIELEDKPDAALVWHLENLAEIEQAGIIKFDKEKEHAVRHPKGEVGENSFEEFIITGE
jgi:hypothetical protein